jgi:hypothetical protein
MAHGQPHVCGSLPQTHVSVHLTFCQAHQAWTVTHHVYEEDGDQFNDVVAFTQTELGPFDGPADVLALTARLLDISGIGHGVRQS